VQRYCKGYALLAMVVMACPWRICLCWGPGERAGVASPATATATAELSTAAGDGKPCTHLSSNQREHNSMGLSSSALPAARSSPAAVGGSRGDGTERGLPLMDGAATASYGGSGRDDHTVGGGCCDAADKVTGAESGGHTNRLDQVAGRGYSLTKFRVVSCVHPTRKVVPGSEVHACLGRNVYILWRGQARTIRRSRLRRRPRGYGGCST